MEVEITWKRLLQIWWAYCWRSLVFMVLSCVAGGLVGVFCAFIAHVTGTSKEPMRVVAICITIPIGLFFSMLGIRFVLNKDYGDFRLALIARNPDTAGDPKP